MADRPVAARVENADSVRAAIDRGETRDKVAAADPAAAPLGSDSEAAGVAPESGRTGPASREETATTARSGDVTERTRMSPGRLLLLVALCAAAAAVVAWWQLGGG